MYTYKLGGMLITDELYHDDLEAVTFGRKDQNELWHYGIKGQSWGKRRFQNEDGSLTMAGRNRYDVGDPRQVQSPHADYKPRVGNGVAAPTRSSGSYGSSMTGQGAKAQPVKAAGVSQQTRNDIAARTAANRQRISNAANTGKKAADSLFGRIGNWATNAAKDVGNFASSAYNDASKAVTGAANDVGNWVGDKAQDVSDWFTGDKAGREAQRYDNVVQNFERNGDRNINEGIDTISKAINIKDKYPNVSEANFDKGIKQRNLGYDQHEIASQYGQKADEAQARYDAAPRQLLNAAGNWIGDRVSDAGNAVGNVLKPGINAVGNAVRDAGNWVGDTAKNIYDDVDYRLYSLGQDIAQPAQNRAWQDFQNKIAQDRETYNREFPGGDYQTWKSASNRIDDAFRDYQRESNKIEQNPIGSAINNVGRSIGEGVQKASDWASNAASDVRDWGAGALDKGRQAFENLFGKSEPANNEQLDPTPRTFTENIEYERIIPENIEYERIIPEQRIPENIEYERIIPEQRIPETREIETRTIEDGFKPIETKPIETKSTVSGSNNVQTWDNGNINTWDNVKTFGDPDMVNTIKMLNDNGFFNRGSSSNSGNSSSMSDKPSNVSDEFWREYTFNGGTRDSYDREINARKNSQNNHSSNSSMTDKPDGVSDEFWRNYTFNGGTRDSYDREINARKNSQNNQNGSASRKEVVGTVDTSRPYHFTYDPASGQTIVVYDDEKRR